MYTYIYVNIYIYIRMSIYEWEKKNWTEVKHVFGCC